MFLLCQLAFEAFSVEALERHCKRKRLLFLVLCSYSFCYHNAASRCLPKDVCQLPRRWFSACWPSWWHLSELLCHSADHTATPLQGSLNFSLGWGWCSGQLFLPRIPRSAPEVVATSHIYYSHLLQALY